MSNSAQFALYRVLCQTEAVLLDYYSGIARSPKTGKFAVVRPFEWAIKYLESDRSSCNRSRNEKYGFTDGLNCGRLDVLTEKYTPLFLDAQREITIGKDCCPSWIMLSNK